LGKYTIATLKLWSNFSTKNISATSTQTKHAGFKEVGSMQVTESRENKLEKK